MTDPIVAYYTGLGRKHGACPAGVGWSATSQAVRFDVIAGIGTLEGRSLLDVGCGYGAFFAYLSDRGVQCDYHGVDMTPLQVELAQTHHPEHADRFRFANGITSGRPDSYDYLVSNGPLNTACDDPLDTMKSLLAAMYAQCRLACIVTMISTRAPRRLKGLHYYDPAAMLSFALDLCPRVRLDHSYLPHDFAISLYKEPVPWT
jgi:SAM-dependent methyltransferase